MELRYINIKGFRGIEDIEIKFPVNTSANIYATNGAGKSTIVKAIECMFMSVNLKETEVFNVYDMFNLKSEISIGISIHNNNYCLKKYFNKNDITCYIDDIEMSQDQYQAQLQEIIGINESTWKALTYPIITLTDKELFKVLNKYTEDFTVKDIIVADRELFTLIDEMEDVEIEPRIKRITNKIEDIKNEITFTEKQITVYQDNINKSASIKDIEELFEAKNELKTLIEQNNQIDRDIAKLKSQYSPEVLIQKIKLLEINIETQEDLLIKNKERARATRERIYKDAQAECDKTKKMFDDINYQLNRTELELNELQKEYDDIKIIYNSIETGARKVCPNCGKKYDQSSRETAINRLRADLDKKEKTLNLKKNEIDRYNNKLQQLELSISKAETLTQKAYSDWLNFDIVEATENTELLKLRTELRRAKKALEEETKQQDILNLINLKETNLILIKEKQDILEINKDIVYHQRELKKLFSKKSELHQELSEKETRLAIYEKFKRKLYSFRTQSIQNYFDGLRIEMDYENKTAKVFSEDSLVPYKDENTAKQIEIALKLADNLSRLEKWKGFVIIDNIECVDSLYSNRQIITMHKLSMQPMFDGYCELDYVERYADTVVENGNKKLYIKYY